MDKIAAICKNITIPYCNVRTWGEIFCWPAEVCDAALTQG